MSSKQWHSRHNRKYWGCCHCASTQKAQIQLEWHCHAQSLPNTKQASKIGWQQLEPSHLCQRLKNALLVMISLEESWHKRATRGDTSCLQLSPELMAGGVMDPSMTFHILMEFVEPKFGYAMDFNGQVLPSFWTGKCESSLMCILQKQTQLNNRNTHYLSSFNEIVQMLLALSDADMFTAEEIANRALKVCKRSSLMMLESWGKLFMRLAQSWWQQNL